MRMHPDPMETFAKEDRGGGRELKLKTQLCIISLTLER